MDGKGWKWLEMVGMAIFFNGWNGQKWLKMYELLEMTGINLKQLEITENGWNGLIGQKCVSKLDMAQNTGMCLEWL